MPRNAHRGSKITRRHSTKISAAQPVIQALCRLPEVQRVVAGIITSGGIRANKIMYLISSGCVKVVVFGGGCKQECLVYTSSPERVCEELQKKFPELIRS